MMKISTTYGLILAIAVLATSSPFTSSNPPPYQAGISEIFFETALLSHHHPHDHSTQFTLNYATQFTAVPLAVVSIAGFEGSFQQQAIAIISIQQLETFGSKLLINSTKTGQVTSAQISYLIFQETFELYFGIWFWENQKQLDKDRPQTRTELVIRLKQIKLNKCQEKLDGQIVKLEKEQTQLRVIPLLSSLLLGEQITTNLVEVQLFAESQTVRVQIKYSEIFERSNLNVRFVLAFSYQTTAGFDAQYIGRLQLVEDTIKGSSHKLTESNQKLLLLGLNAVKLGSKVGKIWLQIQEKQSWINSKFKQDALDEAYGVGFSSLVLLQTYEGRKRLLTGCSTGTYLSPFNWTYNSLVSWPFVTCNVTNNGGQTGGNGGGGWGCPSSQCYPCPLGCLTCSSSNCSMNVSCTSCDTSKGYVAAQTTCGNTQYYCNCNGGKFPSSSTGACDTCANVIPNCQSCATNYFIGTYCSACNTGFYLKNVWVDGYYSYKDGNNNYYSSTSYARLCASCQPGCSNCTDSSSCAKCANNLISTNGQCTCNTTQGQYYNSATQSCTACSTAIAGCSSCSLSVTTTSCTSCSTGYYLNSSTNICVACSTYCSTCNSTNCTQCVSSTFTKTGTSCICSSPLFLNPSTTPPSCLACSTFQANCVTCSNSTGSVLCSTCAAGFFSNAGVCTACIPYCTTCTTITDCTTPVSNLFVYNSSSLSCVCITGYILSNGACLLCSDLVPNCLTCNANGIGCSVCNNPYYPDTSTTPTSCAACPLQCVSCTSSSNCGGCIAGYSLIGAVGSQTCNCTNCTTCTALTSNPSCTDCTNGAGSTGNTCISCLPGSFISGTSCSACPTSCSLCSSTTTCTSCVSPFVLIGTTCGCNTATQQYYDPNYVSTSGNPICWTCGNIFPGCTNCSGSTSTTSVSSTVCTACTTGTFLLGSNSCVTCPTNCTACTSASTCTACTATFIVINGGVCGCDTSSQYFLGLNNNTCQKCSTLVPNCVTCALNATPILVGCVSCALGYYNDANDYCSVCPSTCVNCTSPTSCQSCQNTYSLINGLCVCDSSQQLFDAGGYCSPCYSFVGYCTQCIVTSGVITCSTCGTGTYLKNPTDTSCTLCGANCNTCDSSGCSNCTLGFAPVLGVCTYSNQCQNFAGADPNCVYCYLTSSSTTGCQACQPGYYVNSQGSCVSCPSTCVSCSDYFTCLVCQPTFTLINGVCQCNALTNQVLSSSTCVNCNFLVASCQNCSSNVAPVTCTTCLPTFYLNNLGVCTSCTYGCQTCAQNGNCMTCIPGFTISGTVCNNVQSCTLGTYYDSVNSNCPVCPSNCSSCISATDCLVCASSYTLSNGVCICDNSHGMFYSAQNYQCNLCGSYSSTNFGANYPSNCEVCVNSTNAASFQCLVCSDGYYVSAGTCLSCQPGCNQCSGASSCYLCQAPKYAFSAGNCICNAATNYFQNGSICSQCNLTNCSICLSLNSCSFCSSGSFVNSTTLQCQPQICGNGRLQGVEQCDDNNNIGGDGCSSTCSFQNYFVCTNLVQGQLSVCIAQNNKFKLEISQQISSCNQISIKLKNTGTESISQCQNISNLMVKYQLNYSTLQSATLDEDHLTYTFSYNHSIQGLSFSLVFDPTTLCIKNSDSFPPFNVSGVIKPTNNRAAIYYGQGGCSKLQSAQAFVNTVQYASYATLFLSALPCKIVGLQLFGVLQMAHISLGSVDNINLMLQPLANMGGVNGYRHNLGADKSSRLLQTFTPSRINAIDYNANFIRNCNAMFLVVLGIIAVSFIMYILTYVFKKCAPTFHKVAKRLIKEVLLTLILFNEFNFAYSAGIHFRYAPSQDSLYLLGTLAAAGTLIIPVLMTIALLCTEDEGFGEFKEKLKPGCVERAYFVVTIGYRMGIGLYMSSANQDELSTLILLAFSLFFLLYNLVNLPFTKAYHNYRANICHLTQFVILFVAMFYRSMKSTDALQESASIFTPVYFEYIFIFASLLASLVVLIYEIYIFVKECSCCCKKDNENQILNKTEHGASLEQVQTLPEIFGQEKKQEVIRLQDDYQ